MANPEHIEILKQGVEHWNKWRDENPEIEPDLSGVDFQKVYTISSKSEIIDLSGSNFNKVDLTRAYIGRTNLSNSSLIGITTFESQRNIDSLVLSQLLVSNSLKKQHLSDWCS